MHPDQRVYNMILTKRTFGNVTHTYALLGYENGQQWNLLGGKRDENETYEQAGSRELYEESGLLLDKRGDHSYWNSRPYYEYTKHRVYIHEPGSLDINIEKLNKATNDCRNNPNLRHEYKEMHRYQLIKLSDLVSLSKSKGSSGEHATYNHPTERQPMTINGWMLFTIKNANISELLKYI